METRFKKGGGLFREDWELIEFADDVVVHGPAEEGWLGFETQRVVDATQEIRRGWSEEEHRRRAGIPLELLIPVGRGGIYGDRYDSQTVTGISYQVRPIEFGLSLPGVSYHGTKPPQAGA